MVFWCLDCDKGEEWNFAYMLTDLTGHSTTLVIPISLQMGWVESPPHFCATIETGRDVEMQYCNTLIGSLDDHIFLTHTQGSIAYQDLLEHDKELTTPLRYLVEVYVDDYIGLAIPTTKRQLDHVANGVMCGIHDIFPPDPILEEDPISFKKLQKQDGGWHMDAPKRNPRVHLRR